MGGRKHKILPRIDRNIARANTLPGKAYSSESLYNLMKERVFVPSWQWVGNEQDLPEGTGVFPVEFMPELLDEPLIFSKDNDGKTHLLSNVCTHRGNILAEKPMHCREIRCTYHGRRFELDGTFKHMPHTKGMEDFPSKCDHLPAVKFQNWHGLLFASLEPSVEFETFISGMNPWIKSFPLNKMKYDVSISKTYTIDAHWALYCDNYLEGFHIPFVHPGLTQALDVAQYETHVFEGGVLQTGIAKPGEAVFELPESSPDFGKQVAAYYFWLFPNIMFNFYPWGLSLNVVYPMAVNKTKIDFHTYVWDASLMNQGAGANLHQTEMEDEAVVESVQRGVRSRLYECGRFSPAMEQGVHHFHRMLTKCVNAT